MARLVILKPSVLSLIPVISTCVSHPSYLVVSYRVKSQNVVMRSWKLWCWLQIDLLPYQVVLGCDLPILADLIAKQSGEARAISTSLILLAVTKSKTKQDQLSSVSEWEELPFANEEAPSLPQSRQLRERKTRKQRRQYRLRGLSEWAGVQAFRALCPFLVM